ncbi:MAG: hypothetical protein AUI15_31460 [Actinobacteria bacterium 13_2_20CM_2_66_6]|nr:MAG: hypothetical protein AUI15_31460 [Actinobacteria bacterium 13_2_20CM_2_66_6]
MSVLRKLYQFHFKSESRERLFLASLGFLVTFAAVRAITLSIRAGVGPFHNLSAGSTHIHHLVWGILILLAVGYIWLTEIGVGDLRVPAVGGDLGRTLPARGLPRDLETETEAVPARLTVTKRSAAVLVDQWAPRWHLTGQGMCPP